MNRLLYFTLLVSGLFCTSAVMASELNEQKSVYISFERNENTLKLQRNVYDECGFMVSFGSADELLEKLTYTRNNIHTIAINTCVVLDGNHDELFNDQIHGTFATIPLSGHYIR